MGRIIVRVLTWLWCGLPCRKVYRRMDRCLFFCNEVRR